MSKIICLDPGHGGYDCGAVGQNWLLEKDVNLAVAKYLKELLQKNGLGVIMTREDDNPSWGRNNDLQKRCQMANSAGADYFISIHCNSSKDKSVMGTETYCFRFGGEGEKLARNIQSAIVSSMHTIDRGVKVANFYVLRATRMPAVLVEMEFISNAQVEEQMKTDNWKKQMAECIANGILNYLNMNANKKKIGRKNHGDDVAKKCL